MKKYSSDEVLAVYRGHPLSLAKLQARLHQQGQTASCEDDLAFDPISETTDQNHIGGASFVLEMAEDAGITQVDRVLDLGCGLGGPARLLAERYDCSVHGVDLSAERIEDAKELTRITGLDGRVTFTCADFMSLPPSPIYSVVWGQNSWIHIAEREELLTRAHACLEPGGRVAFEDVCLARPINGAEEELWFETISDAWRSTFATVAEWASAFETAGFRTLSSRDRSPPFHEHYRKLVALAEKDPGAYPTHEIAGWQCARWLGQAGAFCFRRIVAVRS